MSKSQKILLTIVLALILFFAYTINVNAVDYSFISLASNDVTLETGDRFLLDDTVLVGADGIITITEGEIEIKAKKVEDSSSYNLTITLKGEAEINENQVLNIINDTYINKADIIIENESTLTINGTLVLPTKNSPTLTNNGTVIISENGVFELRASATYTGSGTTDVYGTFVIFGADEDPNIGESIVNLYETGKIYSRADVKDNIEVAAIEDGYTFSLETIANNEYSSSVTNDVNTENATLYFLSKEEVVVEEPGIVDDDLTTDDGETTIEEEVVETEEETTTEEEAVETEDETTTEEEATTEEVTETEDETTSNPTTGDTVVVFAIIFVVALAGIVVTIKMRKRIK